MEGFKMPSKVKILDLTIDELIEIAKALNENIIANKTRTKEERIGTDIFIKQTFKINRKDFSATIEPTGIKYNPSTFLYDIPGEYKGVTKGVQPKRVTEVVQNKSKNPSNTKVTPVDKSINEVAITKVLPMELYEVADMSSKLKEVIAWHEEFKNQESVIKELLEWYKSSKLNENIIEIPQISLDKTRLQGEIKTRSFKIYQQVLEDFKAYCEKHGEYKQQDLLSMALIEYMSKYK
jgi:hypothetical protein